MAHTDHYTLLEVDKNATPREVRTAFRRLARQYHPDLNPDNAQAEARFKEINAAYEVLSDPEKRVKYDRQRRKDRHYWRQANDRSASPAWQRWTSSPAEEQVEIEGIAITISLGIAILLAVDSLFETGLAPFFMAAALTGSLLALGWNFSQQSERIRCPNCDQSEITEELPREMLGIFRKRAYSFWSPRYRTWRAVPHAKYKVYCLCANCGYKWRTAKTEKL